MSGGVGTNVAFAISPDQHRNMVGDWGRLFAEWPFAYTPQRISRSEFGFMANVCYDGVALLTTTSVQQQESDGRVSNWKAMASHVQAYPARHVR